MDAVDALIQSLINENEVRATPNYCFKATVRLRLKTLIAAGSSECASTGRIYQAAAQFLDYDRDTIRRYASYMAAQICKMGNQTLLKKIYDNRKGPIGYISPIDMIIYMAKYLYVQEADRRAADSKNAANALPLALPYQTFFPFYTKKSSPELGEHFSYDIAAYGAFFRGEVVVIHDVTTDAALVLRMIDTFNRCNLSPIHLEEAILDMMP